MNLELRASEPATRPLPRHFGFQNKLRFLVRIRYQLLGAALFAVLLPSLIRWPVGPIAFDLGGRQAAMLGTLVAVLAGAMVLRRMTTFPGVAPTAFVLPVFAATYGLVMGAFFFLRIDYSRYQFAASFVLAVVWFFATMTATRRVLRPRLMIVPIGGASRLIDEPDVDWVLALTPTDVPANVGGVVADLRAVLGPDWERFLARCALQQIPVYHYKQVRESLTGAVEVEHLSENNFGSLIPSSLYLQVKRLVDIAAVLVAAIPISLLAAWIAWRIRREDGGPVLFRQQRVGYRGETFQMLKFRSMRLDASGKDFTEENDERITKFGAFIRRTRLDELPQLVNVLRGEMSLIGPRPEARPLANWYESRIPFYSYRHIVRPGISGWAQVNQGNVAMIEAATAKLHYDFYYIKHFSLWLDLLITAKTFRTMLTGFGAR